VSDRNGERRPGPLPRPRARKRALDILYEADLRRGDVRETLERAGNDPEAEPVDAFVRRLVEGVADRREEIDAVIGQHARGWTVPRMPVVDRNLLRLGVFELLHDHQTPPAVVIDQAVELAKTLSTDNSPRYINGVLSAVLRVEGTPPPEQPSDRS
jgi:N utilization substance protein B